MTFDTGLKPLPLEGIDPVAILNLDHPYIGVALDEAIDIIGCFLTRHSAALERLKPGHLSQGGTRLSPDVTAEFEAIKFQDDRTAIVFATLQQIGRLANIVRRNDSRTDQQL